MKGSNNIDTNVDKSAKFINEFSDVLRLRQS